jgi:hypothetical protein
MSQDPLKKRLARIREKAISRYKGMGFHVYTVSHSPIDFMAFRVENERVIEIRQVRVADGQLAPADEKMIRSIPLLSSLCTREICTWDDTDFKTKTI